MLRCLFSGDDALGCIWDGLPWWFQWGFWVCLALLLGGAAMNLATLAKKIAGWPGFAAVLGFAVLLAGLFVFRPRKKGEDLFTIDVDGIDAEPSANRGTVRRPKGKTLMETLKGLSER